MSEKIFGEIDSTEELNELANNLRKTKEFDEIRLLCTENHIAPEVAEDFIKGNRLLLAKEKHQENRKALESETRRAVRDGINKNTAELIKHGLLLPMKPEIFIEVEKESEPKPVDKPMFTIEDVKKKLEAELQIYRDGDSKYVVEKLIEMCRTDKLLLDSIMQPHKSYDKAFQYFYNKSREIGYKMPHGNMVYLDNDRAVQLSVEYFKKDDTAEKKTQSKPVINKPKDNAKSQSADKRKAAPANADVKGEKKLEFKVPEPKKVVVPDKVPKEPKKAGIDGQMSLFDF